MRSHLELQHRLPATCAATSRTTRRRWPRCCATRATPRSRSASGTCARWTNASAAGPYDQWPCQRGFDRFYGFLEGETDQFHPELVYDNHRVDPPAHRRGRATTSARTWSTTRSSSSTTRSRSVPTGRSSSTSRSAPRTRRTRRRPSTSTKYRGRVRRRAGTSPASSGSPASCELGLAPRGHRARAAQPGRRRLGRPAREPAQARGPPAGGVRRRSSTTPTPRSAGSSTRSTDLGELDNTIVVRAVRQRRQPGGRPVRRAARDEVLQLHPRDARRGRSTRIDDIGGPHSHTNYPWGWAQAGNTPFKWYKQNTHEGGVHVPLIVHWPSGIADARRAAPTSSTT